MTPNGILIVPEHSSSSSTTMKEVKPNMPSSSERIPTPEPSQLDEYGRKPRHLMSLGVKHGYQSYLTTTQEAGSGLDRGRYRLKGQESDESK